MEMKIKHTYDLSLHVESVLGSGFRGAELIAIMSYSMACKFDCIDNKQKQVAPYLPDETPRDHRKYTYYQFKYRGEEIIIADYWIVPDSVKLSKGETYQITISNTSSTKINEIIAQLRLQGLEFEVEGL